MELFFNDIESYVQGELTGQKLTDFEAALASDVLLQAAVLEHRELVRRLEGIRLRNAVKTNMLSPIPRFKLGRMSLLILLIGSLCLFVYWYWNGHRQTPPLPVIELPPLVNPSNNATAETLSNTKQRPNEREAVITGDKKTLLAFNEAVNKLVAINFVTMGDGVKDTVIERQLNAAIRMLRNKKPYQADSLLQKVIQKNNLLYLEDAEWLNAMGWLLRDPMKGKQMLRQIEKKPTHSYRRNAIQLLRQL